MKLRIYNTFSAQKENFVPIEQGKVGMYVCGPTVYDSSHIGHARSIVVFDMVYRWLSMLGYKVNYIRNFTDIDDKIIKKSNKTGESCKIITERYIDEFHNEMDALNVIRPAREPKATEHIQHIINFIIRLIKAGKAYQVPNGNVYFSIDSFASYGKLSGRNIDDMRAGARIAVDENKKNPLDFTLWKAAKPEEPFWDSPWGKGRPGWHIECSAMSAEYLGKKFDIHGGGKDLIFPHHENEIAQSEALFGCRFVNYWIHNGFVNINNEKMSKSLGNFTMIKEVVAKYSPEVIRLFLLSKHYRSPIDYNEESMAAIAQGLDRIYAFLQRLNQAGIKEDEDKKNKKDDEKSGQLWVDFVLAMNDDFNSARAIGAIFEVVKLGNKLLDNSKDEPNDSEKAILKLIFSDIKKISAILGIFLITPNDWFNLKKRKQITDQGIDSEFVEKLIKERAEARKNKDFALADAIRNQLLQQNIILEDGPEGTVWRFE